MGLTIKNLGALMPTGTVRYTLTGIEINAPTSVVLIMKHAGQGNDAWLNARRKVDANRNAQSGGADGRAFAESLIPAFARTVIVGWENVINDDGKPESYTAANGEWLLGSLIGNGGLDILNALYGYAFDPANFRDTPPLDAERLGNG